MPRDERLAFEAHLAQGCPACAEQLGRLARVADALARAVPSSRSAAPHGDRTARALRRLGFPGVDFRLLHAQETPPRHWTALVTMTPGSRIPGHAHDGDEEFYLIEGDLRVDDLRLMAGEFHRNPAGTSHGDMVSDSGCRAFLVRFLGENERLPRFLGNVARP